MDINLFPIAFNITPVPAPRMVRSDKYRKRPCVLRYFAFRNELVLLSNLHHYELKSPVFIRFYLQMPSSWSQKKRDKFNLQPHTSKPDIDNLIKSFLDALSTNDQLIWSVWAEKFWSTTNKIIVYTENFKSSSNKNIAFNEV